MVEYHLNNTSVKATATIAAQPKMSYEPWLNYLRTAEKSSIISGKVRKVHYKMTDNAEMLEEYSMDTGILMRRAWKKRTDVLCMKVADDDLSGLLEWDIEVGDLATLPSSGEFMVKESTTAVSTSKEWIYKTSHRNLIVLFLFDFQPILTKRITRKNIEWRIRNLPYTLDTYQVTADAGKNAILVRTTNKKYFKEISVPELKRCGLIPEQTAITIAHQHNTLIISVRMKKTRKQRCPLSLMYIIEDIFFRHSIKSQSC